MTVSGFTSEWRMGGSNPRPSRCQAAETPPRQVPASPTKWRPEADNPSPADPRRDRPADPDGTPSAADPAALSPAYLELQAAVEEYRRARARHQVGAW